MSLLSLFRREPEPDVLEIRHEGEVHLVRVSRSARARRFTLRVRTAAGDAVLTVPQRARFADAKAFAEQHGGWLSARFARLQPANPFAPGAMIPLRGVAHRIVHVPGRRGVGVEAGETGPEIRIGGEAAFLARRLTDYLKAEALKDLTAVSRRHAATLGAGIARVSVRDQKSRWGSCSGGGALSYSWRLIFAPPFVLNYLCAHEVAHLREMNHSQRFWRLVRQLDPDMERAQVWLRVHGAGLHRYGA